MSVSYTTRPKRKSEKEGKDYIFVKKKKFDYLQSKNFFVESAHVFDHFYGTPKNFYQELLFIENLPWLRVCINMNC